MSQPDYYSKYVKLQQLSQTEIKKGKDVNGVPYLKYLYQVHAYYFGETCSSCPTKINMYIRNIQNLKPKKMSEEKTRVFELKKGAVINLYNKQLISKHNLTDELAVKILNENINRKKLFTKVPENLENFLKNANSKVAENDQENGANEVKLTYEERQKQLLNLHWTQLREIAENNGLEYKDKEQTSNEILAIEYPKA